MDNSNLDAKTPRLNPYDAPAGQMKQKREKLPPSPMEGAGNQAPYHAPSPSPPSAGGYPSAMGAMDPYMPDMAGMYDGYPYGSCMTAGYPASGMQGMGYRTSSTPMTGLPITGMAGTGLAAAGMPSARQPAAQAMPEMPAGMPSAGAAGLAPLTPFNQPIPVTTESTLYINGFLRTMIGRRVTVEFLIGTNTFVDRTGILLAVGANYIVINEVETDDILICDFFSIKFVKVYY